jgi:pimeloyl-ACP methyl ester carboxylesterase
VSALYPAPPTLRPADADQRVSWRLTSSGRAVCTVLRPGLGPVLESRSGGDSTTHEVPQLGATSQLLPTEDGQVWMCHHRGGRHFVERLTTEGRILPVATSSAQGLALVDETYALSYDAGSSRLMRLGVGGLHQVAVLDGAAVGAVRLGGDRVAVDVVSGGRCSAVVVDATTGEVEPFVSVSERSDDHVVDFVPEANLLVISTDATGEVRLGVGRPGQAPVTFPAALAGDGPATHVASAPDGSLVAVSFAVGATCEVRVVDVPTGRTIPLDLPPLVVLGRGAVGGGRLVLPVSTPDRPATLLRVDLASGRYSFDDPALPGVASFDVVRLPGGEGALEAVVVGDVATADRVVVALHGGPLSSWKAMFDPLLAELAGAGIAVVAPNIRGSVGYGRDHALAILDRWGGPDLDDVLAVGDAVAGMRPLDASPPCLLGISYGAYLALLAAERAPDEWSGCVALAPFLSGARIAAGGGPVADLVRRLGGTGSPDLRDGLDALAVPVLVLHGEGDDVVPVEESRVLDVELGRRGQSAAVHLLPGVGHDLLASSAGQAVIDSIVGFCRDGAAPATSPSGGARPRLHVRRAHREEE